MCHFSWWQIPDPLWSGRGELVIHCTVDAVSVGIPIAILGCSVHGWNCSSRQVWSRFSTVQYVHCHCLCSTYNYAGKLYNRLFSAFKANNLEGARLEQRRSQAMIKLLFKYGEQCVCTTDSQLLLILTLNVDSAFIIIDFSCSHFHFLMNCVWSQCVWI